MDIFVKHLSLLYEPKMHQVEGLQHRMQVWHLRDEYFDGGRVLWPLCYELVCALRTDDLDEAFRWTNDQSTWEREELRLFPPYGWQDGPDGHTIFQCPRSSMVNDVFVTPAGEFFAVDRVGFYPLS